MMGDDWQVITGDCLEVMPTLAAGSVDAILTDLPYGTTACSWDSVIPFEPMWAAVKHVLKPRGVFVTTASQPFTSALVMSNVKWFRCSLVWDKVTTTGFYNVRNKPLRRHEDLCVFGAAPDTYNPQMSEGTKYSVKNGKPHTTGVYGTQKLLDHKNSGVRYPTSIVPITNSNKVFPKTHPTQKPVALYEYLIRTYTNEGELVLDMCAGSGTTGVAAINTGRRVICIEQREDYADIARARIAKAAEQARQAELPLAAA